MNFYHSLFIFFILFNINFSNKRIASLKLFFTFFLIFILASIRKDFGLDYDVYLNEFNSIKNSVSNITFHDHFEIGYVYLIKLVPSFRILIVLLSFLTCFTYYYLFKKFLTIKQYWLAFLFLMFLNNYILFFNFSGLRNGISICIFLLSLDFIIKRKIFIYIILTYIASLFHSSALLVMPLVYLLINVKQTKNIEIIFLAFFILLIIISNTSSIISLFNPIIFLFFDRYELYYSIILNSDDTRGFLLFALCISIIAYTFILLKTVKISTNNILILKIKILFFISLLLGNINFRFSNYFAIFALLSACIMIKIDYNRLRSSLFSIAFILFILYNHFIVFVNGKYFTYNNFYSILD